MSLSSYSTVPSTSYSPCSCLHTCLIINESLPNQHLAQCCPLVKRICPAECSSSSSWPPSRNKLVTGRNTDHCHNPAMTDYNALVNSLVRVSSRCQCLSWLNQLWLGCVLFKDKLPNNKDRRHELEGFHCEGGKEVTNNTSDWLGPDGVVKAYNPRSRGQEDQTSRPAWGYVRLSPTQKERRGLTKRGTLPFTDLSCTWSHLTSQQPCEVGSTCGHSTDRKVNLQAISWPAQRPTVTNSYKCSVFGLKIQHPTSPHTWPTYFTGIIKIKLVQGSKKYL